MSFSARRVTLRVFSGGQETLSCPITKPCSTARSPIDADKAGIMGYVAATGQMVNIEDVSKTDFYDKTRCSTR